ncbi:MAG: RNA 2',3'-cyclic phosphodiesterase [Candidatus Omnitrophota bacterium]
MRTFIAIELPAQIKNKLSELQELLKESKADVKWTEPANIHITLKFLGEIDEDESVKIAGIIEEMAHKSKQFHIRLFSLGAFPNMELGRVIWVGIDKGDNETKSFAKRLDASLEKLGIPQDKRPFSSHITIGRIKSPLHKDKLAKTFNELKDYFCGKNIEFTVKKITLFKSAPGANGPIYEALKEANIATA